MKEHNVTNKYELHVHFEQSMDLNYRFVDDFLGEKWNQFALLMIAVEPLCSFVTWCVVHIIHLFYIL